MGAREVGYMFGQYKRLRNEFTGVFTGKGQGWGGSLIRPGQQASSRILPFLHLEKSVTPLKVKPLRSQDSVTWHGTAMKATELGAKVVTLSGPDGYIYDPEGMNDEDRLYAGSPRLE